MALRALKAAYDSDSDSEEPSPKRHKAQEQAATATAPAQRDAALLPALPDVITHLAGTLPRLHLVASATHRLACRG